MTAAFPFGIHLKAKNLPHWMPGSNAQGYLQIPFQTVSRFPIPGEPAQSPVASNLKHGIGDIGQYHTAIEGPIVDVTKLDGDAPLGSSGIQIRVKVGMVLEGFRAGGVIRIRPMSWPDPPVPREEYIKGIEDRFPSPDIFRE